MGDFGQQLGNSPSVEKCFILPPEPPPTPSVHILTCSNVDMCVDTDMCAHRCTYTGAHATIDRSLVVRVSPESTLLTAFC